MLISECSLLVCETGPGRAGLHQTRLKKFVSSFGRVVRCGMGSIALNHMMPRQAKRITWPLSETLRHVASAPSRIMEISRRQTTQKIHPLSVLRLRTGLHQPSPESLVKICMLPIQPPLPTRAALHLSSPELLLEIIILPRQPSDQGSDPCRAAPSRPRTLLKLSVLPIQPPFLLSRL